MKEETKNYIRNAIYELADFYEESGAKQRVWMSKNKKELDAIYTYMIDNNYSEYSCDIGLRALKLRKITLRKWLADHDVFIKGE